MTEVTSCILTEQRLHSKFKARGKTSAGRLSSGQRGSLLPALTQEYVKTALSLDQHTAPWFANCLYISISASSGYPISKAGLVR